MDADAQVKWFRKHDNAPADEDASILQSYGTDIWCPSGMKQMPQLRVSMRYDANT
ncbi:hypothetical protein Daus18300_005637 [Diaporthe australafricana]|uniref:Uncharacterized protein n=1 Tax=Diaporthe australafricana TaxID=127596 RepID=A0ABR3WZI2_9PEZI